MEQAAGVDLQLDREQAVRRRLHTFMRSAGSKHAFPTSRPKGNFCKRPAGPTIPARQIGKRYKQFWQSLKTATSPVKSAG
jgi:hypothetical protein